MYQTSTAFPLIKAFLFNKQRGLVIGIQQKSEYKIRLFQKLRDILNLGRGHLFKTAKNSNCAQIRHPLVYALGTVSRKSNHVAGQNALTPLVGRGAKR